MKCNPLLFFSLAFIACQPTIAATQEIGDFLQKYSAGVDRFNSFANTLRKIGPKSMSFQKQRYCMTILLAENELRVLDEYTKKIFLLRECHTQAQAADLFTKHFTNPESWSHAQALIGMLDGWQFARLRLCSRATSEKRGATPAQ